VSMPAPTPRPTPIDSITSREIGFVRSGSPNPPAGPNPPQVANFDGSEASSTVG
jgi:hypothetical protein